jgi:iron complex transport system ATP-binding protein
MPVVLQLSDVSVVRDANPILSNLDWTVEGDERWVILGPNGAGKTTLLQIAAAMSHPSSGTATVLDGKLGRWNEDYEDVDLRRAQRVLAEWKLDHLGNRLFGSLSDGEQKRVQIARSVMTDPELLLLDEPAASLDLGAREELLQLLGGYASSSDSPAIVMVTHHVEEIPRGFTNALLVSGGRIVAAGPLADVLTEDNLQATFGLPITLTEIDGRYSARAA